MDDQYTWKQFKDAVCDLLTVDKNRSGTTSFRDAQLRQAVIYLQSIVDGFRMGHEAIYHAQDVVAEGYASRGTKPPSSEIQDVWLVRLNDDNKTCFRYPLKIVSWDDRFALVNGNGSIAGQPAFCMDPAGYTFYVYPEIKGNWLLSMFWNGQKLEFKEDEATPFTERMVGAVADWVKAKLIREYEKDISLHDSYMRSFSAAKPMLVIDAKERANVKNTAGEGGGVKCGGRLVCKPKCPDADIRYRNPVLVRDGEPTVEAVPDKTVPWIWKDRETGAGWTWDVENQAWI